LEILLNPTVKNVCAVVVTYFPDNDIISRLARIQKQLPSIIIIDNASSESCLSVLRDFSVSPLVVLLENHKNEGLGKALNQAATLARESGFLWVLTLDQDTDVHDDMFDTLAEIYELNACNPPLIGSNYRDVSREKQFFKCSPRFDKEYVERKTVITSGTLMKLDLFKHIGGFREDYFIDSIDHEYCLRVRAGGNRVLMSCCSLMSHSIGRPGPHGRRLLTFDHPPIRKYYMARNTLVTLKSYFWREPAWGLRQMARLMVEFLSIVFFERDKRNKGTAFGRGIIDGLRNKMGRCEWPNVDT
jgi:rhamnosyltransferase